jgi:flagellar basal-body rod protein FlgB
MSTVSLFDLASRQAGWLTTRQAAIASNVANINTPGFKGVDVQPFAAVLNGGGSRLAATHVGHVGGSRAGSALQSGIKQVSSGQAVEIERELMKAGEVQRAYDLNAAIVKSFHKMILSTVRS